VRRTPWVVVGTVFATTLLVPNVLSFAAPAAPAAAGSSAAVPSHRVAVADRVVHPHPSVAHRAVRSVSTVGSQPAASAQPAAVAVPKYDANHLMVLSYHATPTPQSTPPATNPYWTDSAHLANQFAMLKSLGYTSVTVAQVVAWQGHHATLPSRPVLITFDDGNANNWTVADPILAAYHFTAVEFVITGLVDTPGFLTWTQIEAMHASGRWDLEDHTRIAHLGVPIDAAGDLGAGLLNRAYLPLPPSLIRHNHWYFETLAQAETRVRADLVGSVNDLMSHGLPLPLAFAYPGSRYLGPSNDSRLVTYTNYLLSHTMFPLRFSNLLPLPATASFAIQPRLEVHWNPTGATLRAELGA